MVGVGQLELGRGTAERHDGGPRTAIVVGAGIVGLSTAWFLQEHGVEVTVVDRTGVAGGASWGNAGWIAPDLVALHEPAGLRQGLRSLMRPTGSADGLSTSDPGLWGFLARVAANRRWSSWTRAVQDNLSLNDESLEAFDVLAANGVDAPITETSIIAAFRTMRQAEALLGVLDRLEEVGQPVTYTGVFGAALREHAPVASPALAVGVCIEGQRHVDPAAFTHALARSVVARGGTVQPQDILDVRARRGGVRAHARDGQVLDADVAVMATGASLPHLASRWGIPTPLRVNRGFSIAVPVDRRVPCPLYLPETRVTCTPHPDGVRMTGMTAGRAPDIPRQIESMVAATRPLLDGVRWHERSNIWAGDSIVTADGRPLIGASPVPGVYLAGGHDMWGFTHGPVTARLLTEQIVTGMRPDGLAAFDPLRSPGRPHAATSRAAAIPTRRG